MNASWFRHLVQIAPWLTLALLVAMFLFLQMLRLNTFPE